jgi:hypothetical protein
MRDRVTLVLDPRKMVTSPTKVIYIYPAQV